MSCCVYHCKRKLDDKIRHQISIKTNFCRKYFRVTQSVNFFEQSYRCSYHWLKTGRMYAKYSTIIIMHSKKSIRGAVDAIDKCPT